MEIQDEKLKLVSDGLDVPKQPQPGIVVDHRRSLASPGSTVARHYEVLEVLGQGGTSVVYKARHQLIGKTVAIKFLLPTHYLDDRAIDRFKREATAASRLEHKNLGRVNEFGIDDDGNPYLVMDFVDGISLAKLIKHEGPLAEARAADFGQQIVSGLENAHAQGIVHRDLKPSNIMITTVDGVEIAKIVDFGIAKADAETEDEDGRYATVTHTGEVVGSPQYMSPEQCQGYVLDGRSDMYSFGCVLYEMLTGKVLVKGDSVIHTLTMHINGITPDFKGTTVSAGMRSIINRCVLKDRDKRYANMHEVAENLAIAAAGKMPAGGRNEKRILTSMFAAALCVVAIVSVMHSPLLSHRTVAGEGSSSNAVADGNTIEWPNAVANNKRIASLRSLLERQPRDGSTWFDYGSALLDAKDYAAAATAFKNAAILDPADYYAQHHLAYALDLDGKHSEAEIWYRKALKAAPDDTSLMYNFATCLDSQNKRLEAIEACRTALKTAPNDSDCLELLGSDLDAVGQTEEALPFLRKAVAINAEDRNGWMLLAEVEHKLGHVKESAEAQKRVDALVDKDQQ